MTKSELVQRLAEANPHLYQRDVELIVSAIFDEISAALSRGDRVELRGFGAFSVKRRDARQGRNPRTGDSVRVEIRGYRIETGSLACHPAGDRHPHLLRGVQSADCRSQLLAVRERLGMGL